MILHLSTSRPKTFTVLGPGKLKVSGWFQFEFSIVWVDLLVSKCKTDRKYKICDIYAMPSQSSLNHLVIAGYSIVGYICALLHKLL